MQPLPLGRQGADHSKAKSEEIFRRYVVAGFSPRPVVTRASEPGPGRQPLHAVRESRMQ